MLYMHYFMLCQIYVSIYKDGHQTQNSVLLLFSLMFTHFSLKGEHLIDFMIDRAHVFYSRHIFFLFQFLFPTLGDSPIYI